MANSLLKTSGGSSVDLDDFNIALAVLLTDSDGNYLIDDDLQPIVFKYQKSVEVATTVLIVNSDNDYLIDDDSEEFLVEYDVDEYGNVAIPGYVLVGKIFNTDGEDNSILTGTLVDRGTVTATINSGESFIIPDGKHSGDGYVKEPSKYTQTQVASVPNVYYVREGLTYWANGNLYTGKATVSGLTTFAIYNADGSSPTTNGLIKCYLSFKVDGIFSHIRITSATKSLSASSYGVKNYSNMYNYAPDINGTVLYDGALPTPDSNGYYLFNLTNIGYSSSSSYFTYLICSAFPYIIGQDGTRSYYAATNTPVSYCRQICNYTSSSSSGGGCGEGGGCASCSVGCITGGCTTYGS